MKRKFYDGQLVRVIGADWTFSIDGVLSKSGGVVLRVYLSTCARKWVHQWWPEYLLESAE